MLRPQEERAGGTKSDPKQEEVPAPGNSRGEGAPALTRRRPRGHDKHYSDARVLRV